MVGMQYNEGEKVSHGGGVSREAVWALGEDGVEVVPLLGRRSKDRLQQKSWKATASGVG